VSWYEQRILPGLINLACGTKPTRKQREKIVPRAVGDVLEVGFGTGLNLPFYERDKVRHLWALEPSEGMRRRAQRAIEHGHIEVELIEQPCEEIPLDDNSADTVVVTYTMCTIAELLPALEGVRRVLKPTGQLLFCEHGKAPDQNVYEWQERLNPIWRRFSGGCNIHRDIPAILQESGFKIEDDNRMYIPGIKTLSYNYWGAARIR
jgi:ubiquinone/menaquinone biosynthesis C-methylase UbiE